MPYSSGTFSLYTPGNPVVTGTTISSTWANNTLSDIATGLSTAVLKDGTQTLTANIPMGGFKLTGLGAGTAAGNSIRYEQVYTTTALTDGATVAWDASLAPVATWTMGGSRTLSAPSGLKSGGLYGLIITQDGTGGRLVTWDSVFKAQGSLTMPQPETTAGAVTQFTFYSPNGTDLRCLQCMPFIDSNYLVRGSADPTKKLRIEVDAITTATTRVLTMPDEDVTLAAATDTARGTVELATTAEVQTGTDTGRAVTPAALQNGKTVILTPQTTTSGTDFDFTVPSWAKEIDVVLNACSLSGTDHFLIQLSDAGGPENAGYTGVFSSIVNAGAVGSSTISAGFTVGAGGAGASVSAVVRLVLINASTFTWAAYGVGCNTGDSSQKFVMGIKSLSAALTGFRVTRSGADTFDAGSIGGQYR